MLVSIPTQKIRGHTVYLTFATCNKVFGEDTEQVQKEAEDVDSK